MIATVRNPKPAKRKHAPTTQKTTAQKRAHSEKARYDVRALDPVVKCGAGTSVERMFKVVERAGEHATIHLVFLDRHGWYCEHGRACPAVAHAKRH